MNKGKHTYKVTAAGRVNIIGEHVDYCGGKVFPAALSLKNTVYVTPNGTDKINLEWTTLPGKVAFDINALNDYRHLKYGNYQAGSAYEWQKRGHETVGCDMVQSCEIPFGSGLSSSAAIEVSTIAALCAAAGEEFDNVEVALAAQAAEREYVGVNCGIMDQYASACGKKGCAILLDCNTLEREYVPVALGEYTLVLADCKKPHSLVESKYNERRAETDEALRTLQKAVKINCLAELTREMLDEYGKLLHGKVFDRTRHIVLECERVVKARQAMQSGDIATLGRLLNESHASLRDLYEVTGRELDALAEAAQSHGGCAGSRMTGAGFGGCTVSIVKADEVEDFKAYVGERYARETGYSAAFYDAEVSDGITITEL